MRDCEFNLCIYNDDSACVLDEISVSGMGMCDSCIIAEIPEELLTVYKREILDSYKAVHTAWDEENDDDE